jgi:hypothetical protein
MISLEGLQSGVTGEDRAIAILKVEHNSLTYDWMTFVPPDADLATYIAASEGRVKAEIDAKEALWAASPKTREIEGINGAETVAIDKSEVVRADNPDYYASRRTAYPTLADQLDAMWKGADAMTAMAAKIAAVKAKYPKP